MMDVRSFRRRGRATSQRGMAEGIHQPEQSELGQGTGSERGRRAANRLPEQVEAVAQRLALELELDVAAVVQEDTDRSGYDAEQHHGAEELDRAHTRPPSEHDAAREQEREERERDELQRRLEVLEQQQLEHEPDRAKQDERQERTPEKAGRVGTHGQRSVLAA